MEELFDNFETLDPKDWEQQLKPLFTIILKV